MQTPCRHRVCVRLTTVFAVLVAGCESQRANNETLRKRQAWREELAKPGQPLQKQLEPSPQMQSHTPQSQHQDLQPPKPFNNWLYEDSGLYTGNPNARFNLPHAQEMYQLYVANHTARQKMQSEHSFREAQLRTQANKQRNLSTSSQPTELHQYQPPKDYRTWLFEDSGITNAPNQRVNVAQLQQQYGQYLTTYNAFQKAMADQSYREAQLRLQAKRSIQPNQNPVVIAPAPPVPPPAVGASVIETQIDGDFNGWEGETVVKLMNGQVWIQNDYHYEYLYSFMPDVLIYNAGGGYKMKVDGADEAVGVTQLR